ncbi:hypothetical protein CPLU01_13665 [Colletotrichum plurivorum]|uniref:Uncharacterized protein n=1 Tax=Colletotrichum plurivorum TaxID=2175906 RepID=A0A8H6N1P1_9PEZI|nr:hypothetical protein CPLU01_13665 [Colletotrichum plurivorum]
MERQGRTGQARQARHAGPDQGHAKRFQKHATPGQVRGRHLSVSNKADFPSDGHSSRIPATTINGKKGRDSYDRDDKKSSSGGGGLLGGMLGGGGGKDKKDKKDNDGGFTDKVIDGVAEYAKKKCLGRGPDIIISMFDHAYLSNPSTSVITVDIRDHRRHP